MAVPLRTRTESGQGFTGQGTQQRRLLRMKSSHLKGLWRQQELTPVVSPFLTHVSNDVTLSAAVIGLLQWYPDTSIPSGSDIRHPSSDTSHSFTSGTFARSHVLLRLGCVPHIPLR